MAEFASKGVAGTALGLGAGALGVQLLNGNLNDLLGGLFGNNNGNDMLAAAILANGMNNGRGDCHGGHGYDRYDAGKDAEIAELKTEVKLRDANTYTMGEVNKVRDYFERRFDRVEHEIAEQKVYNATNTATISCMGQQINGIQSVLATITKTVIPRDVICPEVMPRYNSWVAPTTPATETPADGT